MHPKREQGKREQQDKEQYEREQRGIAGEKCGLAGNIASKRKDNQKDNSENRCNAARGQHDDAEKLQNMADDLGRLMMQINRLRRRFMSGRLKSYGLAGPAYLFLLTLSRHPGESQDFLAARHGIDKGNVAHVIKQLMKIGCVTRETDPEDRRKRRLLLTDKGEEMAKITRGIISEWSRKISEGLSSSEWMALSELMQKMLDNSKKHFGE